MGEPKEFQLLWLDVVCYYNFSYSFRFVLYFFSLVPQGQPKANYLQGLSIIGVQQIDRVVEVVEETLKGFVCL